MFMLVRLNLYGGKSSLQAGLPAWASTSAARPARKSMQSSRVAWSYRLAPRPPRESLQAGRPAAMKKPAGPAGKACRSGLKPGGLAQPSSKIRH